MKKILSVFTSFLVVLTGCSALQLSPENAVEKTESERLLEQSKNEFLEAESFKFEGTIIDTFLSGDKEVKQVIQLAAKENREENALKIYLNNELSEYVLYVVKNKAFIHDLQNKQWAKIPKHLQVELADEMQLFDPEEKMETWLNYVDLYDIQEDKNVYTLSFSTEEENILRSLNIQFIQVTDHYEAVGAALTNADIVLKINKKTSLLEDIMVTLYFIDKQNGSYTQGKVEISFKLTEVNEIEKITIPEKANENPVEVKQLLNLE